MKGLIIVLLLATFNIQAAPSLYNLTQSNTDDISKEMAANFAHTMVTGATPLGKIFGFEAGLIFGQTTTPTVEAISGKLSSSSSVSSIPNAALVGAVSVPLGFTAEINLFPQITYSGFTLMNESAAIKWCFTCLIADPTFDLAIRAYAGTGKISYSSIVNNTSTGNTNVNTKVTWKNKTTGYNFTLSKKFLFLEPYVGLGIINASTDIGLTAASAVTIFSFTQSNSYSSKNSGTQFFAGLDFNLLLFKLGGEYSRIMGVKKYAGKFTLYF